jgi:cyclohexadienyl dehydratase
MAARTVLIRLALLAFAAQACAGAGAPNSKSPASPDTPGTLHVVTPGDYAPFATCSNAAPTTCEGFDVALVESYAATRGLTITFTRSTWATLSEDLRRHDMAIGGITIKEERARVGRFSAPLVRTGKQALMRCGDLDQFSDWEAIKRDARVVANLGGGNEDFAKAKFGAAKVTILALNKDVPKALLANEADVFFTDGPEAALLARSNTNTLCIGLGGALYDPFELALWFGPSSAELREDFARYQHSEAGQSKIRELRRLYGLP